MRRVAQLSGIFLLAVVLTSCASYPKNLIRTGAVIETTAVILTDTGALFDRLHSEGKITDSEYKAWAEFVPKAQVGLNAARTAWDVLRKNPSVESPKLQEIFDIVQGLATEGARFYEDAVNRL